MPTIPMKIPAPADRSSRIAILVGVTALTLGIHYGWLIEPFFGHVHWLHAIHGRFCYIPIVIAAAWFGLRGGLWQAAAISLLVIPYILVKEIEPHELASETMEIVFYFAIALLVGFLVDREYSARRKQQEAQIQVERSQKLSLVGPVAAGVAHEIKNPLASIKGAADILSDDAASTAERSEFRDILQGEVRRIDGTVREFLDFARPRETRLERLDLSEALRIVARQTEAQARQQGVAVETELQPHVFVAGDPEKLHQMILNLLLNAIEASPSGRPVTLRLLVDPRDRARIEISDHGSGIPPENTERVFEPFFTTKPSGSGLGLAVVKTIVDAHQGQIMINNRETGGTMVSVDLPIHTVSAT